MTICITTCRCLTAGTPWHHQSYLCSTTAACIDLSCDVQAQAHEAKKSSELIGATSEEIQARQRDMSREVIEPTVQTAMTDAYAACCAECGPGQFQRMRVLMKAAVNQQKESMFQEAARKDCCLWDM